MACVADEVLERKVGGFGVASFATASRAVTTKPWVGQESLFRTRTNLFIIEFHVADSVEQLFLNIS